MNIDFDKKLVVIDAPGDHVRQNLCFDPNFVKEQWYRYSGVYLYEECQKRGFQLVTPDIFFGMRQKPKKVIAFRYSVDVEGITKFKDAGVRQAVLIAAENPTYACRLYYSLSSYTRHFDYSVVPAGARDWVSSQSIYRLWLPQHGYWNKVKKVESNFPKKKYLTIINSNQKNHILKKLYTKVMNGIHPLPSFTYRDMYMERLKAISYFSENPEFDFFGWGFDKPIRYARHYAEAIKKSYRGAVDDKFETLKKYKFSIIFENCVWNGLITEKITDSLYAGCVPVYWGAPDITEYIPADCFIDYRQFKNLVELDHYLQNMNERAYNQYIDNINKFIISPAAYRLSKERYVKELIDIFELYF